MPIPGMVSGSIIASSSSKTNEMARVAKGVELGLYTWLSLPTTQVVGVGVGTVGAGSVDGALVVKPNVPFMKLAFMTNGIVGVFASMIYVPIVLGISKPYGFMGVSPSVGSGGYSGGFFGDPVLLSQSLVSGFTTNGLVGKDVKRLCTALAQGIHAHFQVGQVVGSIVGPSGPSPSTAPAIGKFI